MLKLLSLFLILSPMALAQTPTPGPGELDAWGQLATQMGLSARNSGTSPLLRNPVVLPGRVVGPEGRRCVRIVQVGNRWYRKNFWFNISDITRLNLTKASEDPTVAMIDTSKTNGWFPVSLTLYQKYQKLMGLAPNLIANCSVNGVFFPPSLTSGKNKATEVPACDIVKGADVLATDQQWNTITHPEDPTGPSIVHNTRLTVTGYKVGSIGITMNSGSGTYTFGMEIFNGTNSKGLPTTQNLSAPGQTIVFPFSLANSETFVLRAMSGAGGTGGFTYFFRNLPILASQLNPPGPARIPDNITGCATDVPSTADIANMPAIKTTF